LPAGFLVVILIFPIHSGQPTQASVRPFRHLLTVTLAACGPDGTMFSGFATIEAWDQLQTGAAADPDDRWQRPQ